MEPICYIVGAGDTCPADFEKLKKISETDVIYAADGGYTPLFHHHITPDLVIGDFDSCKIPAKDIPDHIPVIHLPPEKDFTDVHTCATEGLSRGFHHFEFFGCTGGRLEHTLANIQLMANLAAGGHRVRMYGISQIYDVLCNASLSLPAKSTGYVSVFSLSDRSCGVTIQGLKYPLKKAELTNTFSLGVSNEYVGTEGFIQVEKGTLLVLHPRDEKGCH